MPAKLAQGRKSRNMSAPRKRGTGNPPFPSRRDSRFGGNGVLTRGFFRSRQAALPRLTVQTFRARVRWPGQEPDQGGAALPGL